MALDFIILLLLLISLSINLLALGAFWVTPGLRTTANRFVINLLIINIIGCIVLTPTLIIGNQKNFSFYSSLKNKSEQKTNVINNKFNIFEIDKLYEKCNNNSCQIGNNEMLNISKNYNLNYLNNSSQTNIRWWSIDLAAALGALSVLLVVSDTWCAVTDPLRYHSRISSPKAWLLIAATWVCGLLFGIMSAVRENVFLSINETNYSKINENFNQTFEIHQSQPNQVYNMIFSTLYFIVIILLPFGFVCAMYWRIFSEARENGLRMRQNGSSPLLQSSLNLTVASGIHSNNNQTNISKYTPSTNSGILMRIDRRNSERDTYRPLPLPVPILTKFRSKDDGHLLIKRDRIQNILLTLSSASDEIKRNYSDRQLKMHEFDGLNSFDNIRQVHSSPNLQKAQLDNCTNTCFDNSSHALQLPTVQNLPKAFGYMTSIRHRLSNASSLFKYREESRAARVSILVVLMFLVSYLPYGFLVLIQGRLTNIFSNSTQIGIVMVLMANMSSPFIFAYRNKRVRRGVKRLFKLQLTHNSQLNSNIGIIKSKKNNSNNNNISVSRNTSKVSSYSVNSCKYLESRALNSNKLLIEVNKGNERDVLNHVSPKIETKTFLKRICKLNCTSYSCVNISDSELTDV